MSKLLGIEPTKRLPIREVKDRLSQVVDSVGRDGHRVMVTRHGRPAAVLVSVEDLAALEETLNALVDDSWVGAIQAGLASVAIGGVIELTHLQALHIARGRSSF